MENILQAFFSWQFLFFCLALGAVVFVIRKVVEYWMENWWPLKNWTAANKDAKLWRELILPILPIILGQVAAIYAVQYPYPQDFKTLSGRMVFGLVAGFTSGLLVRIYRAFLSTKLNDFVSKLPKDTTTDKDSDI